MEENPTLYWYTNFINITSTTDNIKIMHATDNKSFCGVHWFDFIKYLSMLKNWYIAKGGNTATFSGVSPSVLRPLNIFSTYLYRVSWHTDRVSKKNYSESFITVFFISITPRSLSPKFAHSPITRSPIPCSMITFSATLTTWSLFSPNHLLPNFSLAPTHPVTSLLLSNLLPNCLIALPLFFEK